VESNELHSARRTGLIAVAILMAAFVLLHWPFLNYGFSYDYDEGVYWQTLRLLQLDFKLYTEIFYSQLPLSAKMLQLFYSLFSEHLAAARIGVVAISSLLIPAVYGIGKKMDFGRWALLFPLLAVWNSKFFHTSHQLKGDAPALALFAVALYFALHLSKEKRSWTSILLCGFFFFLAVQLKFTVAPGGAVLAVLLLIPDKKPAPLALFTLIFAGLSSITLLGFSWFQHGLPQWQGGAFLAQFTENPMRSDLRIFERILYFFQNESEREFANRLTPVLSLIALAILAWLREFRLLCFLIFFFAVFSLAIFANAVIFPQHYTVFVPFFLLSTGAAFILLTRRARNQKILTAVFSSLLALTLVWDVSAYVLRVRHLSVVSVRQQNDARLSQAIAEHIPHDRLVIAHTPFLAAIADRNVPPAFADTSVIRMRYRTITCDGIKEAFANPQIAGITIGPKTAEIDCGVESLLEDLQKDFGLVRVLEGRESLWIRPRLSR
jgi:4-amino-4-deoxy-L-arabinose transferase-like glycosyltransferase